MTITLLTNFRDFDKQHVDEDTRLDNEFWMQHLNNAAVHGKIGLFI